MINPLLSPRLSRGFSLYPAFARQHTPSVTQRLGQHSSLALGLGALGLGVGTCCASLGRLNRPIPSDAICPTAPRSIAGGRSESAAEPS
jgi:hypothetical protein